jgi:membrane protease YdiL (CAAX protease family)
MGDRAGSARLAFHAALAALIIPPLTLPIGLVLLSWQREALTSGDVEERRWARRLRALVCVDAALTLLLVGAIVFGPRLSPDATQGAARPAYLGGELATHASWILPALATGGLAIFGFVRGARGSLLAGALVLGCLAVDVGAGLLSSRVLGAGLLARWPTLPLLAGSAALIPAGFFAMSTLRDRGLAPIEPLPERVGRTALLGLLYAYGFGWRAGAALIALVRLGVPALQGMTSSDLFGPSVGQGVDLLVVAAVVAAPLGEELVFRGALLGWLRTFASDAQAIALSAAAFALLHAHYRGGMLTIAAYGAALGWARIRSKSLGAPILLHTTINAVAALLLVAQR